MKRTLSRLTAVMMVMLLTLSLAGCGDSKKIEEYNAGIVAATAAINEGNSEFATAVAAFSKEYSNENRQAVLDAVKKMNDGYNQLGNLDAPEKYADVQVKFKEAADLFSQAATIYTEEFNSLTSADKVNDEFVAKLLDGDNLTEQARQKMQEGADKGQEIEGKK